MARSYVIVEEEPGKVAFESILRCLYPSASVDFISTNIDWEVRSAENPSQMPNGLKKSIVEFLTESTKGNYGKLGIIWDQDDHTSEKLIGQINRAIELAIADYLALNPFEPISFDEKLSSPGEFVNLDHRGRKVQVGVYFVNIGGRGELEDVLRAVKKYPSPFADCIDAQLPSCIAAHGISKLDSQKNQIKLWIHNYLRYDTLKEKSTEKNTKWENVLRDRDIFDFGNETVAEFQDLKAFLSSLV